MLVIYAELANPEELAALGGLISGRELATFLLKFTDFYC